MLALVINKSGAARGFQSLDGRTVMVEPGASARIDLADHDLHEAWESAGEVAIVRIGDAELSAQTPKPKRR